MNFQDQMSNSVAAAPAAEGKMSRSASNNSMADAKVPLPASRAASINSPARTRRRSLSNSLRSLNSNDFENPPPVKHERKSLPFGIYRFDMPADGHFDDQYAIHELHQEEAQYLKTLDNLLKRFDQLQEKNPTFANECKDIVNTFHKLIEVHKSIAGYVHGNWKESPWPVFEFFFNEYELYVGKYTAYNHQIAQLTGSNPRMELELKGINHALVKPLVRLIDFRYIFGRIFESLSIRRPAKFMGDFREVYFKFHDLCSDLYKCVGMKDHFGEMIELQNSFDTSKCAQWKEFSSSKNITLQLNKPVHLGHALPTSPENVWGSGFKLVPMKSSGRSKLSASSSQSDKKNKLGSNSMTSFSSMNSNGASIALSSTDKLKKEIWLQLLSDTLLIYKRDKANITSKTLTDYLMYPPIPLALVEVYPVSNKGNVFNLKFPNEIPMVLCAKSDDIQEAFLTRVNDLKRHLISLNSATSNRPSSVLNTPLPTDFSVSVTPSKMMKSPLKMPSNQSTPVSGSLATGQTQEQQTVADSPTAHRTVSGNFHQPKIHERPSANVNITNNLHRHAIMLGQKNVSDSATTFPYTRENEKVDTSTTENNNVSASTASENIENGEDRRLSNSQTVLAISTSSESSILKNQEQEEIKQDQAAAGASEGGYGIDLRSLHNNQIQLGLDGANNTAFGWKPSEEIRQTNSMLTMDQEHHKSIVTTSSLLAESFQKPKTLEDVLQSLRDNPIVHQKTFDLFDYRCHPYVWKTGTDNTKGWISLGINQICLRTSRRETLPEGEYASSWIQVYSKETCLSIMKSRVDFNIKCKVLEPQQQNDANGNSNNSKSTRFVDLVCVNDEGVKARYTIRTKSDEIAADICTKINTELLLCMADLRKRMATHLVTLGCSFDKENIISKQTNVEAYVKDQHDNHSYSLGPCNFVLTDLSKSFNSDVTNNADKIQFGSVGLFSHHGSHIDFLSFPLFEEDVNVMESDRSDKILVFTMLHQGKLYQYELEFKTSDVVHTVMNLMTRVAQKNSMVQEEMKNAILSESVEESNIMVEEQKEQDLEQKGSSEEVNKELEEETERIDSDMEQQTETKDVNESEKEIVNPFLVTGDKKDSSYTLIEFASGGNDQKMDSLKTEQIEDMETRIEISSVIVKDQEENNEYGKEDEIKVEEQTPQEDTEIAFISQEKQNIDNNTILVARSPSKVKRAMSMTAVTGDSNGNHNSSTHSSIMNTHRKTSRGSLPRSAYSTFGTRYTSQGQSETLNSLEQLHRQIEGGLTSETTLSDIKKYEVLRATDPANSFVMYKAMSAEQEQVPMVFDQDMIMDLRRIQHYTSYLKLQIQFSSNENTKLLAIIKALTEENLRLKKTSGTVNKKLVTPLKPKVSTSSSSSSRPNTSSSPTKSASSIPTASAKKGNHVPRVRTAHNVSSSSSSSSTNNSKYIPKNNSLLIQQ